MIIGIDIDNVIADTEKRLRRLLHEEMGITLNREDIRNYSLENIAGIRREEMSFILDRFGNGSIFLDVEVIEGAVETIGLLKEKGHRIALVTSRPDKVRDITREWLEGNGIPYDELYFASNTKVNGIPYDLFLEDQDNFACELAEDGTFVLLFDAPWNRDVEHVNIERVYSWQDVRRFCFPPCALGK
jgi:uncharacterized HAD superfamily protein